MSDYWDEIIESSGNDSIEGFTQKASSLIKLTDKEIAEVIPAGVDQAKFAELMKVVSDASRSNREKADQIRAVSGFAEIAANLLGKFV